MTIAMCYLCPEGVVFGADSTASLQIRQGPIPTGFHFFNHNQKLFELGEGATLGVLTWGLSSLRACSYRTLFAQLSTDFLAVAPATVLEACEKWRDKFWAAYSSDLDIAPLVAFCSAIMSKIPFDPKTPNAVNMRTPQEENALIQIRDMFTVGFCIGGYVIPNRDPAAYYMEISPVSTTIVINSIEMSSHKFWGVPNMIKRLIYGSDDRLKSDLLASGKWSGSESDLDSVLMNQKLAQPILPMRDAVDFVYSCIFSTIKAMKFSNFNQVCGGPIEIAVVTTDRKFRWVRHKEWDVAITDGDPR